MFDYFILFLTSTSLFIFIVSLFLVESTQQFPSSSLSFILSSLPR